MLNQKMKMNLKFGVFLLLLGLFACAEVIDLDTENEGGQLVIFGRITNGAFSNQIRITRTQLSGQVPEGISGARVTVTDDEGNVGQYTGDDEGNYILESPGYVGIPGRAYSLTVTLPNGETYESRPEVMPEISAKDSLYFQIRYKKISDGIYSMNKIRAANQCRFQICKELGGGSCGFGA